MFLLVLDKDPIKSAELVPDKIKFKQLIELYKLICSAGISDVYKTIKQGKELQYWIRNNQGWVKKYGAYLLNWCVENTKISTKTQFKIISILFNLDETIGNEPETAIFRSSKDYKYPLDNNIALPINICIKHYKQYIEWKKLKGVKGYV